MSHLFVFACGFVVGRGWKVLKDVAAPIMDDAARRFDTLYAHTARSIAQTVEDIEDRAVERRVHIASKLVN